MHKLLYVILVCGLLCCASFIASCNDDILSDIGAQPSYELNDSDCYNLGVLLTGHNTATQKLMLYNRNKGELALSSIRLRGGDTSIFRINVDGMAGTDFTNPDFLHIAQGDSLYILVEASFAGAQDERDVLREDFLDILCNGKLQSVRLIVTTRDVEELANDTILRDTTWLEGGIDKLLYGNLTIAAGATLTIEPGVTLYLHDHSSVEVYGTLRIDGTLQNPVTFIGDRTDKIFDNLYYRDMSAQWSGINIYQGSTGNLFNYASIKGMSTGIIISQDSTNTEFLSEVPAGQYIDSDPKRYAYGPDFMSDERQQLIIRNSLIMNSDSSLIAAHNSNMIIENTCLMNSAGALLELAGGAYDITHCTLANYNYWAAFSKCDVVMRNYDAPSDSTRIWRPLYRCNFTNSIIFGNSGLDPNIDANGYAIFVDEGGVPVDSIYNYRLDHCLVHSTTGFDDDDCISILWDADPMYQLVDMANYICDPHLQAESPCIAAGEARTTARLPLDRDGQTRASQPAMGCYERP